jgi:hypothetical protein
MDNLNPKPQAIIKNEFKKMNRCFTQILNNLTSKDFNKIEENEVLTNKISIHFKKISDFLDDLKKENLKKMDIDEENPFNKEIMIDNLTCQKLKDEIIKNCDDITKKLNEQEEHIKRLNHEYSIILQK